MGMFNYQKFMQIYNMTTGDEYWDDYEKFLDDDMPKLLKEYKKKHGITNPDRIKYMERSNRRKMHRESEAYLQTCKLFEIDDRHKHLLLTTRNPSAKEKDLWRMVRMPFRDVFLDVNFNSQDDDRLGYAIHGVLIREMKEYHVETNKDTKQIMNTFIYGLKCFVSGINPDGNAWIEQFIFPLHTLQGNPDIAGLLTRYEDVGVSNFLKEFIINFTLFLKNREVEWVTFTRTEKNKQKRIKQGKMPLPNSHTIKLTGKLKRYVDTMPTGPRDKCGYKYDVRGHWRHLKSEQFKHKKDQTIWIESYEKGEGMKVKKDYAVLPETPEDEMHFDDIKPATRPLREMMLSDKKRKQLDKDRKQHEKEHQQEVERKQKEIQDWKENKRGK